MAEMLVDSTKLDACLDAEADAIRAKTGGTDPIPYDYENSKGFADAIAAIPSGGGSLPTSISELGGGSFTLSTTATCRSTPIQHGLSAAPKGFFIWSDDTFDEEESDTTLFFMNGYATKAGFTNASGQQSGTWAGYYRRSSDKRVTLLNGVISASNVSNFFGASEICLYTNDLRFRQGKTYKWLAWA